MANPIASVADLQARSLRPLTPAELSVAQQWLDDAYAILATQRPFVAEKAAADANYRSLVSQVLCAAVIRVLSNPDGKYQESIDNYSYSRDQAVATGALYISDAELGLIGYGDGSTGGAFTIMPRSAWGLPQPDPWIPYGDGGIP